MGQQTITLRKIYLKETPLLYIEDQTDLPDWKKFWRGLLLDDKLKEYHEMYKKLPKDCKKMVMESDALRRLKHTYDPGENSVIINHEQELESHTKDIFSLMNSSSDHATTIYMEKKGEGEVWSYFFKQETDPSGVKKQAESWKNYSDGMQYAVVNKDFTDLYGSNKMISINGENCPEYCNIVDCCMDPHNPRIYSWKVFGYSLYPYPACDYICEHDGKLLYYAVGQHTAAGEKPAKVVLKTIEYKEGDRNYRVEIPTDAEPSQVEKLLKTLIKNPNLCMIRITGGEKDREIVIYGNESRYFIAAKDDMGVRYSRRLNVYSMSLVQEFGMQIPEMCIYSLPGWLNSFLENIIGSDHGYEFMPWVYFMDDELKVDLPELDFSGAETVDLPK